MQGQGQKEGRNANLRGLSVQSDIAHNMPCVCLRNLVTVITLGSTSSITRSKASSDFILHISFKFPLGKRRREIPPLVKTVQKIQKEET